MTNKRLLVRLIDIALIILLGFIAISRLKTEYVELPAPGNPEPPAREVKETGLRIFGDYFLVESRGKRSRANDVAALESTLVALRDQHENRGERLMMRIASHKSGKMQGLIDVLDICQRQNIDKRVDYEKIR